MFSREKRLNRQKIGEIFKKPDFLFNSKNFILKSSKNNLDFCRFAVVVSKKIAKTAVSRHFLKRKIISGLFDVQTKVGLDLVFFLKKDISNLSKEEVLEELDILIKKCIIDK